MTMLSTLIAPPPYRFAIGRLEILALRDDTGGQRRRPFASALPPGLVRAHPPDGWLRARAYASGRTCLLVRGPGICALVDTGAGATARAPGALAGQLARAGVRPGEIETVILTHAHPGHAGGALDSADRAAFPNARYALAADEWAYWMARPDLRSRRMQRMAERIRARLVALDGRVTLVAGEVEVCPGVRLIPAHGHTAGHLAVSITSAGEELLCLADTVLAPVHLEHPEWVARLDLWPEQSVASRLRLLDRAAATGALLHAYHFAFPGLGWARVADRAWRWEPAVTRSGRTAVNAAFPAPS